MQESRPAPSGQHCSSRQVWQGQKPRSALLTHLRQALCLHPGQRTVWPASAGRDDPTDLHHAAEGVGVRATARLLITFWIGGRGLEDARRMLKESKSLFPKPALLGTPCSIFPARCCPCQSLLFQFRDSLPDWEQNASACCHWPGWLLDTSACSIWDWGAP